MPSTTFIGGACSPLTIRGTTVVAEPIFVELGQNSAKNEFYYDLSLALLDNVAKFDENL